MVDVGVSEQQRPRGTWVVPEIGSVSLHLAASKETNIDADSEISCVENQVRAGDAACCPVELQPHAEIYSL